MSDEEDPEVVADLQLRARSERDKSRRGQAQWSPPKILDRVPCAGRCSRVVDWPEQAQESFDTFNRILARRAEAPLDKTRIVFCEPCRQRGLSERANALPAFHDKVREAIRELKQGCKEERERELFAKLEKAGHPDVPGLKQWLIDNKNKTKRVDRRAL